MDTEDQDKLAKALIAKFKEDCDSSHLDKIVKIYTPLLNSLVKKYPFTDESMEDLLQIAYIGLLTAINKYKEDGGAKFSSYATWFIEGEIKHHLRDQALLKEPRWCKIMNRKISDAIDHLQNKLKRLPTVSEISDYINVTEEGILESLRVRKQIQLISLDDSGFDEGEERHESLDKIKSKRYETFHLPIEDQIVLERALNQLSEIQKKVIYCLFYMDLTQTEVAKRLGLNQRKVSRVQKEAVSELRKSLSEDDGS